jgi:rare lipoprotein A
MNTKIISFLFSILTSLMLSNYFNIPQQKEKNKEKAKEKPIEVKEVKEKVIATTKIDTSKIKLKNVVAEIDSLKTLEIGKLKLLKKNAHASYYADKFNGRKTASGTIFSNNKYTAAHKKLPFGTKVKVTNEANGKFVIVEITDRGPFTKAREIDLSKKAFMDIVTNKNSGTMMVTIEVIEK